MHQTSVSTKHTVRCKQGSEAKLHVFHTSEGAEATFEMAYAKIHSTAWASISDTQEKRATD